MRAIADPLDLERNVVLERFEFSVQLSNLWRAHGWVHETVRTIRSPLFNEFVIWILGASWSPRFQQSVEGWKAVDELLGLLAERNPDFRVVFRGEFRSFHYNSNGAGSDIDVQDGINIRSIIDDQFPLVSSKSLVKFERVVCVENRFWKLGVL